MHRWATLSPPLSLFIYIYIYIYIYNGLDSKLRYCIYSQTFPHEKDVAISRLSLTSLKSEFSFSKIGYRSKIKALSLPNYLPIVAGRKVGAYTSQGYQREVKCEQDLNSCRIYFLRQYLLHQERLILFSQPLRSSSLWHKVNF